MAEQDNISSSKHFGGIMADDLSVDETLRPEKTPLESFEEERGSSEDRALRPQRLCDYIGQEDAKRQLEIAIKAARKRQTAMDHVLIFGPPGLGKTTLSSIISN